MGRKIGVIDIGTVSTRVLVAQDDGDSIVSLERHTEITNLGEGRSSNKKLNPEALKRTVECVRRYLSLIRVHQVDAVLTVLTSAARDADNIGLLLESLKEMGLEPQVVSGEIEARLAFAGVAFDFIDQRIMLVDIGGGSTELVVGTLRSGQHDEGEVRYQFDLESVRSFDVGCKRLSELFERHDPPLAGDVSNAREHLIEEFGAYFLDIEPTEQMICVGGTPTSLVAVEKGLEPYNSAEVHMASLNGAQVSELLELFMSMPTSQREELAGLQEKRAPVIVSGALILQTIMALAGLAEVRVSENDLLVGLAYAALSQLEGRPIDMDWKPELSGAVNESFLVETLL